MINHKMINHSINNKFRKYIADLL